MSSSLSTTSAPPPAPSGKRWYSASCHCKTVRYRCLLNEHLRVNHCNCSICSKLGYLLVYPPRDCVQWISGLDSMGVYRFGPCEQDHRFCATCGTSVGIDSKGCRGFDGWRMSVRLFEGLDLDALEYKKSDGKNEVNPEFNEKYW